MELAAPSERGLCQILAVDGVHEVNPEELSWNRAMPKRPMLGETEQGSDARCTWELLYSYIQLCVPVQTCRNSLLLMLFLSGVRRVEFCIAPPFPSAARFEMEA